MRADNPDPGSGGEVDPSSSPEAPKRHPVDPVLPTRSSDDLGWSDEMGRGTGYDDDWYLQERPPHHG